MRDRTPPLIAVSMACFALAAPSLAFAQAGTITKDMQNNCANDYKKFCGDYGLQTAAAAGFLTRLWSIEPAWCR